MDNFVSLLRISASNTEQSVKNVELDASDRAILGALTRNARTSYRDLAAQAHLSPNATAERMRRLQELGVIKGFRIEIEPSSLGLNLQAFIDVKLQKGTTMDTFERTLARIAGVEEAVSLTGAFDVRLRVVCKDPTQLGELIEQLRVQAGVQETSATVIVRRLNLKIGEPRGKGLVR
ncbi:MAG: Lrp/AsnC family transcriptional regulator [Terracidiphilus sp.]